MYGVAVLALESEARSVAGYKGAVMDGGAQYGQGNPAASDSCNFT